MNTIAVCVYGHNNCLFLGFVFEKNVELLSVEVCGTYTYHQTLNG